VDLPLLDFGTDVNLGLEPCNVEMYLRQCQASFGMQNSALSFCL
jgi:hypothetical protein